ncbi:hypothetical protein WDU94_003438 [Cyamophila willieti]
MSSDTKKQANNCTVEKIDLDRSQLASILNTIREQQKAKNTSKKLHKPLPQFVPTTSRSSQTPKTIVEKITSRVYFADRVKYAIGERVGRASFENNEGRPFQLPNIKGPQSIRYEKTIWQRISQDITLPSEEIQAECSQNHYTLPIGKKSFNIPSLGTHQKKSFPKTSATSTNLPKTSLKTSSSSPSQVQISNNRPKKPPKTSNLPLHKKHTLNTIQNAQILQDLNLFNSAQEEAAKTKLPKHILNVDPDFFKIVHGRKIKSKFEPNYVATVRRVLLTKLRTGVIKDEINKVRSQFIQDKQILDETRDKLTQDYAKYEQFVRDDYKQVMLIENRSKVSWRQLAQAEAEYEIAHNNYYDVRISLFKLDEKWSYAKLCKNFVYLMTSLNQVQNDEEKLTLINKVNKLNQMNVSNNLEDIVNNFKQDLVVLKQEIEERKREKISENLEKKKVLRRKTTDYEIFEGDFTEVEEKDTRKELRVEQEHEEALIKQLTEVEIKEEITIIEDSVTTTPDIDATTPEPDGEIEQSTEQYTKDDSKDIEQDTKTQEDKDQHEKEDQYDYTDSDEDEFIKLIIMDDTELEKDVGATQTARISDSIDPDIYQQFKDELDFELSDIDHEYNMENVDNIGIVLDKLDAENMNVLLQKESVKEKLEQYMKIKETSEEQFKVKTEQLKETVVELEEQVNHLREDIALIRNAIKTNYEAYMNETCSNKTNLVLEVLIADLYQRCVSKHLHTYSTLELLTRFQDRVQFLLASINVLPKPIVDAAKAFVTRNIAETTKSAAHAQRKLNELDNYVQHLERSLAPPYKKIGKPLLPRSKPPTTPPPKLKQIQRLTQDDLDYLTLFTNYDPRAPNAEEMAESYLRQRKI